MSKFGYEKIISASLIVTLVATGILDITLYYLAKWPIRDIIDLSTLIMLGYGLLGTVVMAISFVVYILFRFLTKGKKSMPTKIPNEKGQGAVEYLMIIGLVAIVAIYALALQPLWPMFLVGGAAICSLLGLAWTGLRLRTLWKQKPMKKYAPAPIPARTNDHRGESGQGTVEYAVVLGLVAGITIVILAIFGQKLAELTQFFVLVAIAISIAFIVIMTALARLLNWAYIEWYHWRAAKKYSLNRADDKKRSESGQGVIEYSLMMVLVAVVVIIILALLGPATGNAISTLTHGNESLKTTIIAVASILSFICIGIAVARQGYIRWAQKRDAKKSPSEPKENDGNKSGESGEGLVLYALVMVLLAVVVIVVLALFGPAIGDAAHSLAVHETPTARGLAGIAFLVFLMLGSIISVYFVFKKG